MKQRSSYIKRSPLPRSLTPIARRKAPAKTNAKRKAREFARTYSSKERVAFVKSLPCVYCLSLSSLFGLIESNSHNAHTEGGGAGRKGPYTSIIPLCARHHRCYDERFVPFDERHLRAALKREAVNVEAAWQSFRASVPATPQEK